MQDLVYGLPRTPLPRTLVNNALVCPASLSTPGHRSDETFVGLRRLGGHRGAYYHHVAPRLKHHRGHPNLESVAALPYLRLHIIARNALVVEVLVEELEAVVEQFLQPVVMI